MSQEAGGLHGKDKIGRDLLGPMLTGLGLRQVVEGRVDFRGHKLLGVALEIATRWQRSGIHCAAPIGITPAGGADPEPRPVLPSVSWCSSCHNVFLRC